MIVLDLAAQSAMNQFQIEKYRNQHQITNCLFVEQQIQIYKIKQKTIPQDNELAGSDEAAYNGLILTGYNLPKPSSAVTGERKYFAPKEKSKDWVAFEQFNPQDSHLRKIKLQLKEKALGFNEDNLPDKARLINILFTFAPEHPSSSVFDFAPLAQKISKFDFLMGAKRGRTFKKQKLRETNMLRINTNRSQQRPKRKRFNFKKLNE